LSHDVANWEFALDATTNANLSFKQAGTTKAQLRHAADVEAGLLSVQQGMWKFGGRANQYATIQNPSASTGFQNVLHLDSNTNSAAMTINLPAIADYAGVFFELVDAVGSAGTYSITVQPQTGEKLNGVTDGTFVLDQNYQTATVWGSTAGWYIESNTKVDECLRIDADTNHLKFLDRDGGSDDNGLLVQYTETATNSGKLKLFMDVADYNENYIELHTGATPGIYINKQEGTNVDGFVVNTGSVFKLGTGTTHAVEFHTGNSSRMVLGTAGELEITNTSANQLKLNDGTDNVTFDVDSNAMVVHHDSNWDLKVDSNSGANANIRFSEAGTSKAGILHRGDTASGMVELEGWFKWKVQAASSATVNLSATHGNVIACDTTGNAMQINLPAVANYGGSALYIIDSKSNAGTHNITVAVQTGEKMDGVTNGIVLIKVDNGNVLVMATADGWWSFNP